jgi:ribonuclease J
MHICIHRGTKEIGGTCIEIESGGKRLVLDVGLPLDATEPDELELHPVAGFAEPDPSLLGVCISHAHPDHYGLAHRLPKATPYLIGKAAEAILAAAAPFTPFGITFDSVVHLQDRQPISLGPFSVTPFLVDHSAYDAYAILVEADGHRVFYSGDLRAHGRKGSLFEKLIRSPPENVDVLLMEGTTVGRAGTDEGWPSETALEADFAERFQRAKGMCFVWCSSQNIDRLVTIFKASRRAGRQLILDMYTAHILRATGNQKLPQAHWAGIRVFLPKSQRWRIKRDKLFDLSNSYRRWRIFPEDLPEVAPTSVMIFRPGMIPDVEEARCYDDACLIYSLWPGYLERDQTRPLLEWLKTHNIPMHRCHTSGHASVGDLQRLRAAFAQAVVVPVHLDRRDRYVEIFDNAEVREDGEWWGV